MNKFWKIRNSVDDERAEIIIYGPIGEMGWDETQVTAADFANDLKALGNKDVTIRINSPGGDVFQAHAIFNLIRAYPGETHCHIDGICASAATIIACAAKSVIMPENALFMIHNPQLYAGWMDFNDIDKAKDELSALTDTIVSVYQGKTSGKCSEDEIREMMNNETWMSAEEAMKLGFVDKVDNFAVSASLNNRNQLVINNLAMPMIRMHQDEIISKINGKEPDTMETQDKNLISKIRDILGIKKETPKENHDAVVVKAEQERIKAINALRGDNEYVNAILDVAAEHGASSEEIKPYIDAVSKVEPKNKTLEEIRALVMDNLESGTEQIKPKPASDKRVKDNGVNEVVDIVNKKRG